MPRRLVSDLALAGVAAGGAAAITFPAGFGWGEFVFVACLLGLLLTGLRQAWRAWAAATAQRRRARALAAISPTAAALRAADDESERMAADIHGALRRFLDGIATSAQSARRVPPPDPAGLEHLASIRHQGVMATTELRRMLGLLRSTARGTEEARPSTPIFSRRAAVGRATLLGLMLVEILLIAEFWGEGNGIRPGSSWGWVMLQVMLSLVMVVLFFAPLATAVVCACCAAVLVLGYVLEAPVLDGLWLGFVLALLAWRSLARNPGDWRGYVALAALGLAAANSIRAFSPGNLAVHALLWCGAIVMAVAARLADHLGQSAHARALLSEQELAAETERAVLARRLAVARELHDAVSGTVGVIVAQAGAAEVQWTTRPERAQASLEVIMEAVDHARHDLHRMAPTRPAPTPVPGVAEIPALVARMRSAGIEVRLTHLERQVPADAGSAAYRIIQECLANVARHAPGAVATVTVRLDEGVLEVCVSDDGPGLTMHDTGGYGLTGLRERAAQLDGTLSLRSVGDGLRVVARLPMRGQLQCGPAGREEIVDGADSHRGG